MKGSSTWAPGFRGTTGVLKACGVEGRALEGFRGMQSGAKTRPSVHGHWLSCRCDCKKFDSHWRCPCGAVWGDHATVFQSKAEREAAGKPVENVGKGGAAFEAACGGITRFSSLVSGVMRTVSVSSTRLLLLYNGTRRWLPPGCHWPVPAASAGSEIDTGRDTGRGSDRGRGMDRHLGTGRRARGRGDDRGRGRGRWSSTGRCRNKGKGKPRAPPGCVVLGECVCLRG